MQCYTNNYNNSKKVQLFNLFIYKSQNVMLSEKASCKRTQFYITSVKNRYYVLFIYSPLPNYTLCTEMIHTNLNTVAISR